MPLAVVAIAQPEMPALQALRLPITRSLKSLAKAGKAAGFLNFMSQATTS